MGKSLLKRDLAAKGSVRLIIQCSFFGLRGTPPLYPNIYNITQWPGNVPVSLWEMPDTNNCSGIIEYLSELFQWTFVLNCLHIIIYIFYMVCLIVKIVDVSRDFRSFLIQGQEQIFSKFVDFVKNFGRILYFFIWFMILAWRCHWFPTHPRSF